MPLLRDTVRDPAAYSADMLNVNIHNRRWVPTVEAAFTNIARNAATAGAILAVDSEFAPASVLLRTAALVAITHREHTDKGAVRDTPEILKLFPQNDYY